MDRNSSEDISAGSSSDSESDIDLINVNQREITVDSIIQSLAEKGIGHGGYDGLLHPLNLKMVLAMAVSSSGAKPPDLEKVSKKQLEDAIRIHCPDLSAEISGQASQPDEYSEPMIHDLFSIAAPRKKQRYCRTGDVRKGDRPVEQVLKDAIRDYPWVILRSFNGDQFVGCRLCPEVASWNVELFGDPTEKETQPLPRADPYQPKLLNFFNPPTHLPTIDDGTARVNTTVEPATATTTAHGTATINTTVGPATATTTGHGTATINTTVGPATATTTAHWTAAIKPVRLKFKADTWAATAVLVNEKIGGKFREHERTGAHKIAVATLSVPGAKQGVVKAQNLTDMKVPLRDQANKCSAFVCSYFIARNNLPFCMYPRLSPLFESLSAVGLDKPASRSSRFACQEIIKHIVTSMRDRVWGEILHSDSPLVLLFDEASLIHRNDICILIRTVIPYNSPRPMTVLLDILDLGTERGSESIFDCLMGVLTSRGISSGILESRLVAIICDGCSVNISTTTRSVTGRFVSQFPNCKVFHCYSHQLELSLKRALRQLPSVGVMGEICNRVYSHFSRSGKCLQELKDICKEIGANFRMPLRVIPTRWVGSIRDCLVVLLLMLDPLVLYFERKRDALVRILSSVEFIGSVLAMIDVTSAVAVFSKSTQSESLTISAAVIAYDSLIDELARLPRSTTSLSARLEEAIPTGAFGRIQMYTAPDAPAVSIDELTSAVSSCLYERFGPKFSSPLITSLANLSPDRLASVRDDSDFVVDAASMLSDESEIDPAPVRQQITAALASRLPRSLILSGSAGSELGKLMRIVDVINPSNAATERVFSTCKRVLTSIRNRLSTVMLGHVAFIIMHAPPTSLFSPLPYLESYKPAKLVSTPVNEAALTDDAIDTIKQKEALWSILTKK